jgi:hypothetical protein
MSNNQFLDYNLPQNAYASFDAITLKQLIIDRLNTNSIFKDQNFEGSNLNSVIDIVAFSYHVLLFYLNQTSSETTFSQATLYENINKIVSLVGYKPIGRQTSIVSVDYTAQQELNPTIYNIPRFANLSISGITYSTIDDVNCEKTTDADEDVSVDNPFLYQGTVTEYPTYVATGEEFETIFVSYENFVDTTDQRFIADNTFRVFVKEAFSSKWYQWVEAASLFDESGSARSFEKRLNEYGRFELRFGDDITGRKLQPNDEVAIYFVYSDGSRGLISENTISGKTLNPFLTNRFNSILSDIYSDIKTITNTELRSVTLVNPNRSLDVTVEESVDQIKTNVPKFVNSQNRAVTIQDYNLFLQKNFRSYLASSSTINNFDFIDSYLKYFYGIGLKTPNTDTNLLINQVDFMTSTNFNNVYVFMVPKLGAVNSNNAPSFLSQSQKQLILNELSKVKMVSQQIVPMDAVYQAFDFGIDIPTVPLSINAKDESTLVVVRSKNSKQSKEKIKNDVYNVLKDYFSIDNASIGQLVDLQSISNTILSIQGIFTVYTTRVNNNTTYRSNGLSLMYWNPIYPTQDLNITAQPVQLEKFKYPYLNDINNLAKKIQVIDE